jgi:hypothetical protein
VSQRKRATVKAAAPAAAAPPSSKANDDFWADSIAIADAPKKPAPEPAASTSTAKGLTGSPSTGPSKSKADAPPKKKKSKAPKVRWGFDWGKVAAGLGAFLIFGGITAAMAMSTGRISIYLAVLALGGLFTMLNGLMGEEGIW